MSARQSTMRRLASSRWSASDSGATSGPEPGFGNWGFLESGAVMRSDSRPVAGRETVGLSPAYGSWIARAFPPRALAGEGWGEGRLVGRFPLWGFGVEGRTKSAFTRPSP